MQTVLSIEMSKRKWEDFPIENLHKLYADGGIPYQEYLEAIDMQEQKHRDWDKRKDYDWGRPQAWNADDASA